MSEKEELRAYERAIAEHLRDLAGVDSALAAVYRKVSVRVSVEVAKLGDDVTVFKLDTMIQAELAKTRDARARAIKGAADAAERAGVEMGASVDERAFTATQLDGTADTTRAASERIAKRVKVPNRTKLSKNIRKWDRDLGGKVAREVKDSIRQQRGILSAAEKIRKVDTITDKLPQYLQELEDAARIGDGQRVKDLSKRYLKDAREKLGKVTAEGKRVGSKFSLRGPTQRFVRSMRKAGPEDIDGIVAQYIEERALWRARVIARTETVQAFRRSYAEHASKRPGVVGIRWTLSNRHPIADECDVYASQNLHGLGPGGYPVDRLPRSHPNCICHTAAIIDDAHFRRDTPAGAKEPRPWVDKRSPNGLGWLKNNPKAAAEILGPTRHAMLKRGVNVLQPDGTPKKVSTLLRGAGKGKSGKR